MTGERTGALVFAWFGALLFISSLLLLLHAYFVTFGRVAPAGPAGPGSAHRRRAFFRLRPPSQRVRAQRRKVVDDSARLVGPRTIGLYLDCQPVADRRHPALASSAGAAVRTPWCVGGAVLCDSMHWTSPHSTRLLDARHFGSRWRPTGSSSWRIGPGSYSARDDRPLRIRPPPPVFLLAPRRLRDAPHDDDPVDLRGGEQCLSRLCHSI